MRSFPDGRIDFQVVTHATCRAGVQDEGECCNGCQEHFHGVFGMGRNALRRVRSRRVCKGACLIWLNFGYDGAWPSSGWQFRLNSQVHQFHQLNISDVAGWRKGRGAGRSLRILLRGAEEMTDSLFSPVAH